MAFVDGDSTSHKPIGRQREMRDVRYRRHALATPTGDIRHDDIGTEVQLRLDEEPPTAGTVLAVLEGTAKRAEQHTGCMRMRRRRPRRRVELAAQDLRDEVLRNRAEILVGRVLLERLAHAPEPSTARTSAHQARISRARRVTRRTARAAADSCPCRRGTSRGLAASCSSTNSTSRPGASSPSASSRC